MEVIEEPQAVPFERAFSGAPWETRVGYYRALRAQDHVYVTGTAAVDDQGRTLAAGDAYAQAARCLEIIDQALTDLGADRSRVVRTRMLVTDIARRADFGRAHREYFADHPPATTLVQVGRLIEPDMLIEIEVDAVSPRDSGTASGTA